MNVLQEKYVVLALCIGGLTSIAHAGSMGSLDLSYTGMGAGSRVVINYSGSGGPTISEKAVWSGELNYTVGAASGAGSSLSGHQFTTFSIDIWQWAGSMNADLGTLADGPASNGVTNMGADRAGLLGALYNFAESHELLQAGNGFSGPDQDVLATAFQLAIWEIVSEDRFDPTAGSFGDSGLDIMSGAFYVTPMGNGAYLPGVLSLAQRMLNNAWDTWTPGSETSLLSASGNGGQDVIVHVIPLPNSLIMSVLGLVGAIVLRRRLTP